MPELAPGIVSAGLGRVPVAQTFLDIGQGNRVNEALYDGELPILYVEDGRVPAPLWDRVTTRRERAGRHRPRAARRDPRATPGSQSSPTASSGLATLIAVDRDGAVTVADPSTCAAGCGPGFTLMRTPAPGAAAN